MTVYTYGEDLYYDMLGAIRQAKEEIFFETFIWKSDAIGQSFKRALIEAADRGVEVYVVLRRLRQPRRAATASSPSRATSGSAGTR